MKNTRNKMAKTDYNSIIRNKIRDFIGSKKWSVSRFASRYVEEFIKLYSRQEAPSTSTSRKLVEEYGHIYTEREVTVLDSFTNMDFYQTWLEGEKAKVIELSNRYLGTDNGGTSIDSPAMLRDSIAKLSSKDVHITLDDIAGVINRFVAMDCAMPLMLTSPSQVLMRAALKLISPKYTIVEIDKSDLIDSVKSMLGIASGGEKTIGWIVTNERKVLNLIKEVFTKDVFLLNFNWSDPMTESLKRQLDDSDPANRAWLAGRLKSCLKVRPDWHDLFKKMVKVCVLSPWVEFPYYENVGQWMNFLETKYQQFKPILNDGVLREELILLIDNQIPEKWLTDECNPMSLLECIRDYKVWKSVKEQTISDLESDKAKEVYMKALDKFESTEFRALMLWGDTTNYDYESWTQWFEDRLIFNLVDWDYYKLIDVIRVSSLRHK